MGNGAAVCALSRAEIDNLRQNSVFSADEIRALWHHFKTISYNQQSITRAQFQAAMLFRDSALLDRIFRVFDGDDNNLVDFPEYVKCLSVISTKGSKDSKLKLTFDIYDFDGDGFISAADMTAVTAATLREHDIVIPRDAVDQIVEQTMKEANCATPGMISFSEFVALTGNRPYILMHLSLNVSGIISEYSAATGANFKTPRPPV